MKRSHYCNDVREEHIEKTVTLFGWVNRRRDHGGVIFVDLRDRSGIVQVVFSPERNAEVHNKAHVLRNEFVLKIEGTVAPRPKETENPKMATGMIEVDVDGKHQAHLSLSRPAPSPDATQPRLPAPGKSCHA